MGCFPVEKALQKTKAGSFQSENQSTSFTTSYLWPKLLKILPAKIFLVATPLFAHLFLGTSYSLYVKQTPQSWEVKQKLCLDDTGIIFNNQYMSFIIGKCWHSVAERELNSSLLKWDWLHQTSRILNVGVRATLVLQDSCNSQHNHLHNFVQSHLQLLLEKDGMNFIFKVFLFSSLLREPLLFQIFC